MTGMFSWITMAESRGERLVANDVVGRAEIDTCRVTDGSHPYETGVKHPDYNDGRWVIVEAYDTREAAEAGHARWGQAFSSEPLPESLTDCQNAGISQLIASQSMVFPRGPR